MLVVGIDEMTIVIQINKDDTDVLEWNDSARDIINMIEEVLEIETLFGVGHWATNNNPRGYTIGRDYERMPYYFRIAFHDAHWKMGVIVKFSALSLAAYKQRCKNLLGIEITEFEIIQILNSLGYCARLSRIDLTADYINEDLSVDRIYKELMSDIIDVRYSNGRKNTSTIQAIEKNGIVSTFYLGRRVKNSRAMLRIYDKKLEQIETSGEYMHKALEYSNWVRFEAEFRAEYAHDLSAEMLKIQTLEEQGKMIAKAITDKYSFMIADKDKLTKWTELLMRAIEDCEFTFSKIETRNRDLFRSYRYLVDYSGLISFLFKVKEIWGEDEIRKVMHGFLKELEEYKATDDVHGWLNKFADEYKELKRTEMPLPWHVQKGE